MRLEDYGPHVVLLHYGSGFVDYGLPKKEYIDIYMSTDSFILSIAGNDILQVSKTNFNSWGFTGWSVFVSDDPGYGCGKYNKLAQELMKFDSNLLSLKQFEQLLLVICDACQDAYE